MMKILFLIISSWICSFNLAQSIVFAELSSSPVMNTTGWNLTGSAYLGDTVGDVDANSIC